jgi:anti-anti-sigma factor
MTAKPRVLVQTIKQATIVTFEDSSLVDTLHIDQISKELYDLVDKQDRRKLVLDLEKVVYLSSSALRVFLALREKLGRKDGQLILCGISKDIMKMFKVTSLHKLFKFAKTEDEALEQLGVVMA